MVFKTLFNILLSSRYVIHIVILVLLIENSFAQQKEYVFNSKGNICNFNYICYSQNNEYESIKRPFIFIIGKSGETTIETYINDSLKKSPQFYNYMFV